MSSTKTTINPEALKNLIAYLINDDLPQVNQQTKITLLDAAFPKKKEPKWVPKDGDVVWFLWGNGTMGDHKYTPSDADKLRMGSILPTREAAEKRKAQWIALANEEESV